MSDDDKNARWPCALLAYVEEYAFPGVDSAAAYLIEQKDKKWGTHRYVMRATDVWELLTKTQQAAIENRPTR